MGPRPDAGRTTGPSLGLGPLTARLPVLPLPPSAALGCHPGEVLVRVHSCKRPSSLSLD